ncbi:MAG: IS200/IS605 family transposase [Bacteroidetes bacterium]|nr:IS200/IS605 family transposase [Bacteroidota bacterium]
MKPSVFSQIYIHLVFSPRKREACLHEEIQKEVYSYISKTITNKNHKSINVNGMPDHIHILVGLNPSMTISDLVRDIKRSSSLYINENKLIATKFQWQEGYGVFSYSRSHLERIYHYIENQKIHHQRRNFKDEYMEFLKKFEIPFDNRFLFEFFD